MASTEVPWPEPQSPEGFREPLQAPWRAPEGDDGQTRTLKRAKTSERRMTLRDFINISISMAGAQIAWTLELGQAPPSL